MTLFAAIDFETANRYRNSACAVAIVLANENGILKTYSSLIRPPQLHFEFTSIHGIAASDVRDAPTWGEIHDHVMNLLQDIEFLAAHNASFDKSVMNAVCRHWARPPHPGPWKCTVRLARETWNLHPTKLPDVCRHLSIPLRHHDALSDAQACARIVLAALVSG